MIDAHLACEAATITTNQVTCLTCPKHVLTTATLRHVYFIKEWAGAAHKELMNDCIKLV